MNPSNSCGQCYKAKILSPGQENLGCLWVTYPIGWLPPFNRKGDLMPLVFIEDCSEMLSLRLHIIKDHKFFVKFIYLEFSLSLHQRKTVTLSFGKNSGF